MHLHHSDGRVFDFTNNELSPADVLPGDVVWVEEDILLVMSVDGDHANTIEHPAAVAMMSAALNHPQGAKWGIAEAMRIHAREMAKGWLLAVQHKLVVLPSTDDNGPDTPHAISLGCDDPEGDAPGSTPNEAPLGEPLPEGL